MNKLENNFSCFVAFCLIAAAVFFTRLYFQYDRWILNEERQTLSDQVERMQYQISELNAIINEQQSKLQRVSALCVCAEEQVNSYRPLKKD